MDLGEEKSHINVLEPKAAKLATMTFAITKKKGTSIHVIIDNMVVPSYLIKIGDKKTQELATISKEIWDYLLLN